MSETLPYPQERSDMNHEDRRHYDSRLDELSGTVERLETMVADLTAGVERIIAVAETLEGLAKLWTRATGGLWIVKQVLLCLAVLGAGVVGCKQVIELFK